MTRGDTRGRENESTRVSSRRRWRAAAWTWGVFSLVSLGAWGLSLVCWINLPGEPEAISVSCWSIKHGAIRYESFHSPESSDTRAAQVYRLFLPVAYTPRRVVWWNGVSSDPVWKPSLKMETVQVQVSRGDDPLPRSRIAVLPMWIPFAAFLVPTLLILRRIRRTVEIGHCRQCGYNLTGAPHKQCPECGSSVPKRVPGRQSATRQEPS